MPKKRLNPDNGVITNTVTFSGDDFAVIAEAAEKLRQQDAANPADDFDPADSLKRILKLRGKVLAAKSRAETAKATLKETDEYEDAKFQADLHKGLEAELNDLLAELGREYPLFERRM